MARDHSAERRPAGESFEFVDTPRLELDQLLRQLVDRAEDVISAQSRVSGLLAANQTIIGDLDLPTVLRRIIEAAVKLVRARYGALGVLAPAGNGLEQFVHVGIDDETAAAIGPLPSGKGLLGALIDDPRPIRLREMTDDIRSSGFPPHHPPMSSFLGVPIRVRDVVFGNLYLTEAEAGEFTVEDEELVTALAATAGVAIENARLYEEAQRRQRWLQASAEITQQLLATEGEEPLELIAERTLEIADADLVTVVLPTADGTKLMVEVAAGELADDLIGFTYPVEQTLVGRSFATGRPVLVSDAVSDPNVYLHLREVVAVGAVMIVPLIGARGNRGALAVGRKQGRHVFDEADLDMAQTFADHAAVALELTDARKDQQRMVLLEDRDRIARDLHDHVIQRLFAAGLTVQGIAAGMKDDERGDRLRAVVDSTDEIIRQIRTTIFQLRGELGPRTGTIRTAVLDAAAEASATLGFEPHVTFSGPVDSMVPAALRDDVIAVVRETLSNAARHAQASTVSVALLARDNELTISVVDDGVGMGETSRRSGLANLRSRAERLGGSFSIESNTTPQHRGTRVRWMIPLP